MLYYSRCFCQIKKIKTVFFLSGFIFLLLVASCSTKTTKDKKDPPLWSSVTAEAKWFKGIPDLKYKDDEGNLYVHPFYDLNPYLDYENLETNFFVVNVEGSNEIYDFDLSSGRLFYEQKSCVRLDLWNTYKGTLSRFPYTEGIVPRILNQEGRPLKIFVFGRKDFYKKNQGALSHEVRVIGGLVLETCVQIPCKKRSSKVVSLALIGVDTADSKYSDIHDLNDIKKVVDWNYVLAFTQNRYAVKHSETSYLPIVKVQSEVGPYKAFKRATSKKLILYGKDLASMRVNCHKLYDKFWNEVGKLKQQEYKILVEKVMKLEAQKRQIAKGEKIEDSSKEGNLGLQRSEEFFKSFKKYFIKYGKETETCMKYVKVSDGRRNYFKHWTLSFFESFFKLMELGFVYDCDMKNWRKHSIYQEAVAETIKNLKRCPVKNFDLAFSRGVNFLAHLKQSQQRHYRYVEYDNGTKGTHEKLFSWVFDEGKVLNCRKEYETRDLSKIVLFPEDVEWVPFRNFHKERMETIR